MSHLLAASLLLLTAGAAPLPLDLFHSPAEVSAVTGNGRLTVSLNPSGGIAVCRWPSPGYANQIDDRSSGGAAWQLGPEAEGRMHAMEFSEVKQRYLNDSSIAIETLKENAAAKFATRELAFVLPEQDVLVLRYEMAGSVGLPSVEWFANFDPRTRPSAPAPLWPGLFTPSGDFAAFVDEATQTVFHFRPEEVRTAAVRKFEDFVRTHDFAALDRQFPDGAWIAYRPLEGPATLACSSTVPMQTPQASGGESRISSYALGATVSRAQFEPLDEAPLFTATLAIAFAHSRQEALALLDTAQARGYDALLASCETYWRSFLGGVALPQKLGGETRALAQRDLLTIALLSDATSGAIVRGPVVDSLLGCDLPEWNADVALALDEAGLPDRAARHLLFYTEAVLTSGEASGAMAPLPHALQANGQAALPQSWVNLRAQSALIFHVWRHTARLEGDERRAFRERTWPAVEAAANFLARWWSADRGLPLASFNSRYSRDAATPEDLIFVYVGLHHAIELGKELGKSDPLWVKRRADLVSLIARHLFEGEQAWTIEAPLETWPLGEALGGTNRWESTLLHAVDRLAGAQGSGAVRAAWALAMRWPVDRPMPITTGEAILSALQRGHHSSEWSAQPGPDLPEWPDAAAAAWSYLTLMKLDELLRVEGAPNPPE